MSESSPMMEQYRRIKRELRDEVLFFRLGDFYEMFAQDAVEVSSLLNLTLTSRNGVPMCGVPYHASRSYIARLLKLGRKVAVCEQLSLPGPGKGLADRRVTEILTPGTAVEDEYLEAGDSAYLAAIAEKAGKVAFAFLEPASGEFRACSFPRASCGPALCRELERIRPRELIVHESLLEEDEGAAAAVAQRPGLAVDRWPDWLFDAEEGRSRLERQFGTAGLGGFGLDPRGAEAAAAGALLRYLDDTSRSQLPHVREILLYGDDDFVGIDESSQRNLELVRNMRDGEARYSLLEVLDETKTSMGLRLLKRRILRPLRSPEAVENRLEAVDALYRSQPRLAALRDALSGSLDLERLCARVAMDKAGPKDLAALRSSLAAFAAVEAAAEAAGLGSYRDEDGCAPPDGSAAERLAALASLLERAVADDPPVLVSDGGLVREGYDPELDALRRLREDGRGLLEAYLEEEKAATGIPGLKIRYNRLIGYFFEVSKAHLRSVPERFIRRQGMAGGERFTTDRLAALESEINGAADRIAELEKKIFLRLRDSAKEAVGDLLAAARRMSGLDVVQSLARAATVRGWIRPRVDGENRVRIVEGRHPVVEAHLPRGEFVPNDVLLDAAGVPFALVTGPNMAGKSTYLRQAALIVVMAQVGSFVPAAEAEIGVVDRVFCRVGASDNLARGESTFLVEMNETANILRSATGRSLVIMDEVGRGTGTNDGLSIAWAVCEELLDGIGCRTLFATHYHELSGLGHPRMANRSMEVLEREGEIVFTKKLREGAAAESYGLHVARLAGLSERVLARSRAVLERLRRNETELRSAFAKAAASASPAAAAGLDSADAALASPPSAGTAAERLAAALGALEVDRTTPLEALAFLASWQAELGVSRRDAVAPKKTGRGAPPASLSLSFD